MTLLPRRAGSGRVLPAGRPGRDGGVARWSQSHVCWCWWGWGVPGDAAEGPRAPEM